MHRDVKTANILVDARPGRPDHVYLSDFGLTKGSAWSSTNLTATGHFMGTLDYSAPEQIRGQKVDARTDEYALACVAFVLLTGRPPFQRDEAMAVMYAQLSEPPPMLGSLRPGLPAAVDEVMRRGLAKAPEDRYPGCGEFADALRAALGLQRYSSDAASPPQPPVPAGHAPSLADQASLTVSRRPRRSGQVLEQFQQTFARQRHTLGADHPDTLATRFRLAQEMAAAGITPGPRRNFVLFAARRKPGPRTPRDADGPVQHRPGEGGARQSCRS